MFTQLIKSLALVFGLGFSTPGNTDQVEIRRGNSPTMGVCGNVGQPCCVNDVCMPGAFCMSPSCGAPAHCVLHESCGLAGEVCCEGRLCLNGLTCDTIGFCGSCL